MSLQRRVELTLFLVGLIAFGWFNQGGGWNQNARFAEVRAIVDGGKLPIDDYFAYRRHGGKGLRRLPVVNGIVYDGATRKRLNWVGMNGDLTPVNGGDPKGEEIEDVPIDSVACSGDVSFARGHFHPNKPPGLSFAAVPAYFVLSHFERLMHRDPDTWWLMNVNAWLTSVFSVGIIAAGGLVLAFRIALRLGGGQVWPAMWAAVTFGFGTLFFPFATLLFDHDVTAVLLLAAFYLIFMGAGVGCAGLAGLAAGMAAITNYIAAVPVAMLGMYLLLTRWRERGLGAMVGEPVCFCAGMAGPFAAICMYNAACYGSPFALCNAFQNPAFIDKGPAFLGMFGIPDPFVALVLLVSPFRGIFYGAPVLAMGVYGLWRMRRTRPVEMWLFLGIAVTFFLVNCSFTGWHAGFSSGSRYLIPATAFLAIPSVYGFLAFPRFAGVLLAVSVGINFLFTATDAESPAGVGSLAMAGDRPMYLYSPLVDYAAPLFFQKRAWPLLELLIRERLEEESARLEEAGAGPAQRAVALKGMDAELRQGIASGSDEPLELGAYTGPVSANPTGVCEGGYFNLFEPNSPQARWNSFNAGEFWFPVSRWSVAPLFFIVGLLGLKLAREAAGTRRAVPEETVEMAPD